MVTLRRLCHGFRECVGEMIVSVMNHTWLQKTHGPVIQARGQFYFEE